MSRDNEVFSELSLYPSIGRAGWLVPQRMDVPELLDLGEGSIADMQASLDDLWRINRCLGGLNAITHHLYPRLRALNTAVTIADIGTGSADIPAAVIRWAQTRGLPIRLIGFDLAERHLAVAQRRMQQLTAVKLVQADAAHLPLKPGTMDYVISSLFVHHFAPEQAVHLLRHLYTSARRGVIISDLTRGWLPLIGFKLVQPVFARSYITRYDGVVSVYRGYTPGEFAALARAAGILNARVYRHPLWRMTLVADK